MIPMLIGKMYDVWCMMFDVIFHPTSCSDESTLLPIRRSPYKDCCIVCHPSICFYEEGWAIRCQMFDVWCVPGSRPYILLQTSYISHLFPRQVSCIYAPRVLQVDFVFLLLARHSLSELSLCACFVRRSIGLLESYAKFALKVATALCVFALSAVRSNTCTTTQQLLCHDKLFFLFSQILIAIYYPYCEPTEQRAPSSLLVWPSREEGGRSQIATLFLYCVSHNYQFSIVNCQLAIRLYPNTSIVSVYCLWFIVYSQWLVYSFEFFRRMTSARLSRWPFYFPLSTS